MDSSLAKRIWGTDDAYVKINNYFCKYGTYSKITNSKRKDLYVDFNDEKFFIPLIIKTLIENSDTVKSPLVYYRGDSSFAKQTLKEKVSQVLKKDITWADNFATSSNTSLFRVKVDPGVKKNCYWN